MQVLFLFFMENDKAFRNISIKSGGNAVIPPLFIMLYVYLRYKFYALKIECTAGEKLQLDGHFALYGGQL